MKKYNKKALDDIKDNLDEDNIKDHTIKKVIRQIKKWKSPDNFLATTYPIVAVRCVFLREVRREQTPVNVNYPDTATQ